MAQARALEACARAEVEVVIMSGRREPQVHEAARLMGQGSYIFEAGCAFALDGETILLTGEMQPDEYEGTVYEQIESRGIPALLFDHFEGRLETTRPGTTAASTRTSSAARSTSTRPTRCSASTATTTSACSTTARSAPR